MRKEEEKSKGAVATLKPREEKENPRVDGDQQQGEPHQNDACKRYSQV